MKAFLSMALILTSLCVQAQQKQIELDKSPMDMSYWPNNYPILKMKGQAKAMPVARIIYGRPLKDKRVIFGNILKYDEVWRLGANEATEIEFFSNVRIGGKLINKGRYTMYCIPHEDKWTLIINRDNYMWGHFKYDSKKDVVRKDVDIEKYIARKDTDAEKNDTPEPLTIYFEETPGGANLVIIWSDIKASLPITLINK